MRGGRVAPFSPSSQVTVTSNEESPGNKFLMLLGILASALVTVGAIGGMAYFSTLENEYTNQYLVLTGLRTRDIMASNSYSMQTVLGDDPKTRLYVCMMQAGIGQAAGECPQSTTAVGLRDCLKLKNIDCEASSDGNWPRDNGFLQCIGKTFTTTTKKLNKFIQCEDLSDSIMVDSVQTPYSMLFLGSYNFATLLLASLSALASFMWFTAGGIYDGSKISTSSKNSHLNGFFSPLTSFMTIFSFIWSLVMLVASYAYAFPYDCDGTPCITKPRAYPTTPWTGILCTGMFFGLSGYYFSYIVERYNTYKDVSDSKDEEDKANNIPRAIMPPPAMPRLMPPPVMPRLLPPPPPQSNPIFLPNQSTPPSRPPPLPPRGARVVEEDNVYSPENYEDQAAGVFGSVNPRGARSKFNKNWGYSLLGVKLHTETSSVNGQENAEMFPLMVEAFAWAFIFVDGLLFLGMINPQNSPMHENVTTMFTAILACRILQLAVAKFMDQAFIAKVEGNNGWRSTVSPQQFGNQVTLIFTYLASLGFLVIALINFCNANDVLRTINEGVSSPIYFIEIFFIILVCILPEVVRSIQLAIFCSSDVDPNKILFWTELLFAWNWIFRVIFILIALLVVPSHLREQSNIVREFTGVLPYT